MSVRYWIMKSEPTSYSIGDLALEGRTPWEGVRNYQARNYMRDDMRVGDVVFFYHSNCAEPGIVGEGTVCSTPYPDKTAHDPTSPYFDHKSTQGIVRWYLVDVQYGSTYTHPITLHDLKQDPKLTDLMVVQKGNRLSITPLSDEAGKYLQSLGHTL